MHSGRYAAGVVLGTITLPFGNDILRKPSLSALETEIWIRTLDGDIQAILLRKNEQRNQNMAARGPVVTRFFRQAYEE